MPERVGVIMTEDGRDHTDSPSPKVVAALLREARSVSRRADKLAAEVAAVQDPAIQELAAQASSSIDQLVHQLMRLDQQATMKGAGDLVRVQRVGFQKSAWAFDLQRCMIATVSLRLLY